MSRYNTVSKLLTKSDGELQSLLKHAHHLQNLSRALQNAIDPVLASHINVANIRDNTAIVTADSPAWLTKIRYLGPTILSCLIQQPGLENLNKIQFKVQTPDEPEASTHEGRRASLSSSSAKVLESAASGIQDPHLASALQRLSRHSK